MISITWYHLTDFLNLLYGHATYLIIVIEDWWDCFRPSENFTVEFNVFRWEKIHVE